MNKILFICHGNICRSTMAESVMKDLVRKAGRQHEFVIDSAAISREEIGNPVHRGTVRKLHKEGVPVCEHYARQFRASEYGDWDLIVYMDDENLGGLHRICRDDPEDKFVKLLSFVDGKPGQSAANVADPWYTGDFDATWRDVLSGCKALLAYVG